MFLNCCHQQTLHATILSVVLFCCWQLWVLNNESFGVNGATTGQKSRFKYYVIKWKKQKQKELSLFQQTWKRKQHVAQSQWSQWKPFGYLQWILDKVKGCEQMNVIMHGCYLAPHFISMKITEKTLVTCCFSSELLFDVFGGVLIACFSMSLRLPEPFWNLLQKKTMVWISCLDKSAEFFFF